MIIWLCLRWWYSAGWQWAWRRMVIDRCRWVLETFSTEDLLRTLFAPFRQTFAGRSKGPLGDRFRAFVDRQISRVIGLIVRLILLTMAATMLLVTLITGCIVMILWPFIPLLPVIAVVCLITGVGA